MSTQMVALEKLHAPDHRAMGHNVPDAEVGERVELLLDLGRQGPLVRFVTCKNIRVPAPPAGKPIGAQGGKGDLADEEGVLPGAIQIVRPEIELVPRMAG